MNDNQNDTPNGGIRIGDAERNEAVRRLGEHYEAGRLSSDEHSERVDQALRGTTRDDLDALFRDLPRDPSESQWPGPGQQTNNAQQDPGPQRGSGQQGPPRQGWLGGQTGGRYGSGAPSGGPPWARGGGRRGPRLYGVPVPLVALVALLAVAGIACSVVGGHPPGLLILAAIITTVVVLKRRRGAPSRA
jgi:uncharacterized protein DUF1707